MRMKTQSLSRFFVMNKLIFYEKSSIGFVNRGFLCVVSINPTRHRMRLYHHMCAHSEKKDRFLAK